MLCCSCKRGTPIFCKSGSSFVANASPPKTPNITPTTGNAICTVFDKNRSGCLKNKSRAILALIFPALLSLLIASCVIIIAVISLIEKSPFNNSSTIIITISNLFSFICLSALGQLFKMLLFAVSLLLASTQI